MESGFTKPSVGLNVMKSDAFDTPLDFDWHQTAVDRINSRNNFG